MSKFTSFWKKEDSEGPSEDAEKMGIEGAGPVPNSLLARQDLEGKTTKHNMNDYCAWLAQLRSFGITKRTDLITKLMEEFGLREEEAQEVLTLDSQAEKSTDPKDLMIERIAAGQSQKMDREIQARKAVGRNDFKDSWRKQNHG